MPLHLRVVNLTLKKQSLTMKADMILDWQFSKTRIDLMTNSCLKPKILNRVHMLNIERLHVESSSLIIVLELGVALLPKV